MKLAEIQETQVDETCWGSTQPISQLEEKKSIIFNSKLMSLSLPMKFNGIGIEKGNDTVYETSQFAYFEKIIGTRNQSITKEFESQRRKLS